MSLGLARTTACSKEIERERARARHSGGTVDVTSSLFSSRQHFIATAYSAYLGVLLEDARQLRVHHDLLRAEYAVRLLPAAAWWSNRRVERHSQFGGGGEGSIGGVSRRCAGGSSKVGRRQQGVGATYKLLRLIRHGGALDREAKRP